MSPQPRNVRWPGRWFVSSLALAVVMVPALLYAQDAPPLGLRSRGGEIHEAIAAEGIPLTSVRQNRDGSYELVFSEACSAAERQAAEAIKREILSAPVGKIEVTSLQDALVVLRFEPDNASAQALVRARYAELRKQARGR